MGLGIRHKWKLVIAILITLSALTAIVALFTAPPHTTCDKSLLHTPQIAFDQIAHRQSNFTLELKYAKFGARYEIMVWGNGSYLYSQQVPHDSKHSGSLNDTQMKAFAEYLTQSNVSRLRNRYGGCSKFNDAGFVTLRVSTKNSQINVSGEWDSIPHELVDLHDHLLNLTNGTGLYGIYG